MDTYQFLRSNQTLKQYISKYFIFWQCDIQAADSFIRYYAVAHPPHVSVLHPTGERRLYHDGVLSPDAILLGCMFLITLFLWNIIFY